MSLKVLAACSFFAFVLLGLGQQARATLTLLGTENFTVSSDPDITNPFSMFSQSPTTLTLVVPFFDGNTLGGFFNSTYDWSEVSVFGLLMAKDTTGNDPNAGFTLAFFDDTEFLVARYQGTTEGISNFPSEVTLSFSVAGSGDSSAIKSMQFTWDASSSGSSGGIVVTGIVPEPSTWALLGLGGATLGMAALRRRRKGVTA
jgi:hypothetical protein